LATWVAELEPQVVSEPTERGGGSLEPDELWRERTFPLALVSGLTLFAACVEGYHPFAEDGGLYIAGVKRLLDPSLYPQQTAFVLEPTRLSLFAPMVAGVVRLSHLSLPWSLLALHLTSIWLTLFAAWMLASRCWTSRPARAGAVTLLACWLSLPVAGTALLLMDPYVTARSFSTPAMILALVGALDWSMQNWGEPDSFVILSGAKNPRILSAEANQYANRRTVSAVTEIGAKSSRWRGFCLWAASLLLATAMHPLMASYALAATLMLLCVRSLRREVRLWGTSLLVASALALAVCLQVLASPESAAYLRVALTRTYWFVAEWRWFELLGLAAPLAILSAFAWDRMGFAGKMRPSCDLTPEETSRQSLAQMSVAVGAAAWLVAALFARASAATHLVARLQPLRVFQIVYLILVLMLGAQLGARLLRRSAWRWAAAMLLLGGVMFSAQRASFPHSNHLELPGVAPQNPWVQAFLWVRRSTPTDALFALDPDYINSRDEDAQCFRAIAERSALADYSKDGGEASIAPELTAEWAREQAAQQGMNASSTTDPDRLAALRPLGVTWLVLQAGAATGLDCPYRNAAVKVCRLR